MMIQIHLIQALMRSEAFQKLHLLSNTIQSEQKTQNPTTNLSSLLPVLKDEITENVFQQNRILETDTVELTSKDSNQFLQQNIAFENSAFKNFFIKMDGRKKNGKIDPDFCHLLFSLELNYLKELLIDVKVQNRILSIAIYNQSEGIELLVEELKSTLQSNLENYGYRLSSIKIVNPASYDNHQGRTRFDGNHERVDMKI